MVIGDDGCRLGLGGRPGAAEARSRRSRSSTSTCGVWKVRPARLRRRTSSRPPASRFKNGRAYWASVICRY